MRSGTTALLAWATAALAASRTSAPAGCITVSKSTSGAFRTVQAAVDSLSTTSTAAQCIFIDQGTYAEQVLVGARAARLTVYGYTADTSTGVFTIQASGDNTTVRVP